MRCSVEGCDRRKKSRGLCEMHYQRFMASGSVGSAEPLRQADRGCSIEGCDRPHNARGFCAFHYRQVPEVADALREARVQLQTPEWHRRRRYKLSEAAWQALFDSQERRCLICRCEEPRGSQWVVHHDHRCCPGRSTCGRCVVAILCRLCNVALGSFNDDPELLARAAVVASMVTLSGDLDGQVIAVSADGQRKLLTV